MRTLRLGGLHTVGESGLDPHMHEPQTQGGNVKVIYVIQQSMQTVIEMIVSNILVRTCSTYSCLHFS
jgi:hypothetical protein